MKLATWNINSVRLRLDQVLRFLKEQKPDVLCLQETKVVNELFPGQALAQAGYRHQAIHGQKGYHGVAILSRLPFAKTTSRQFCGKDDTRHICVQFEDGLELHNFYVPAGGDVPDPKANEKFAHKLDFLREMERMFAKRRGKKSARVILVGDLNIAPLEHDVWSHKQLLDVVSHTPVETALMGEARAALDWIDVTRTFVPENKKIYSWWSYRAADWAESDRGRRLDHIWFGQGLAGAARKHAILKKMRGWTQPSDHVPVVVDFETKAALGLLLHRRDHDRGRGRGDHLAVLARERGLEEIDLTAALEDARFGNVAAGRALIEIAHLHLQRRRDLAPLQHQPRRDREHVVHDAGNGAAMQRAEAVEMRLAERIGDLRPAAFRCRSRAVPAEPGRARRRRASEWPEYWRDSPRAWRDRRSGA